MAGGKTPGKVSGEVRRHGHQPGLVRLADRQLRVKRPRLRRKTGGEVAVPAYQALRESEERQTLRHTRNQVLQDCYSTKKH